MKIKLPIGFLIIDIIAVFLILAVVFIPSSIVRIILGLPFIVFFPGYTLVAALFIGKQSKSGIELIALSFGMSIAVVGLIGLGLNYTPLGISLESILYSVAVFIVVMSVIAFIRRNRSQETRGLTTEYNLRLPGWKGSAFNKSLSILLVISILGITGVLAYVLAVPRTGEVFTEFYILGLSGKAQDYPAEFTMRNGQVINVSNNTGDDTVGGWGEVILGVVNYEQQKVTYSIIIKIDNEIVDINYNGTTTNQLGPVELKPEEKWEQVAGFAPRHTGDNQKVEFLLFKDDEATAGESLYLWINVTEAE